MHLIKWTLSQSNDNCIIDKVEMLYVFRDSLETYVLEIVPQVA